MLSLHRFVFIVLLFWGASFSAFSQIDTLQISAESAAAIATESRLPHYLHANRWGLLRQDEADAYLLIGARSVFSASKKWTFRTAFSATAKAQLDQSHLQEYYVEALYGAFLVRAGSKNQTVGLAPAMLSSGSLALSRNARPIPMLGVGIPEFTPLPFTKGFLEVKGMVNHGWFEKNRFVDNAYLHQKYGYLKIGATKKIQLIGGLVHHAQWGGNNDVRGQLPSGIGDLWTVIKGHSIDGSRDTAGVLRPEVQNALGNHLGIYDLAIDVQWKGFSVRLYHQVPFEDNSSLRPFNNPDGLTGITIKPPEGKRFWPTVVYEILHTKFQGGPGLPDTVVNQSNYGYEYGGRDDYYNNIIYRRGWTRYGQVLGTPLFHTSEQAEDYVENLRDFNNFIVNNRVTAHHLGLSGMINERWKYRSFFTYTNNFGTYNGLNNSAVSFATIEDPSFEYFYGGGLWQVYSMLELKHTPEFAKDLEFTAAVSADFGELYNDLGFLLGIRWQGHIIPSQKEN